MIATLDVLLALLYAAQIVGLFVVALVFVAWIESDTDDE